MSRVSLTQSRAGIVIISAGPAAVMLLERLLAQHRRDTPELPLEIRLVDPHAPGGGRIWRREQSPLLKLNSMLQDVAFFTDASCELEGPIAPGPTLAEWVEGVRAGAFELPDWADEALLHEIATAAPTDFPTRRLNHAYLDWAFDETLRRAASTVSVTWQRDVVTAVNAGGHAPGDPHAVHLASGAELRADVVELRDRAQVPGRIVLPGQRVQALRERLPVGGRGHRQRGPAAARHDPAPAVLFARLDAGARADVGCSGAVGRRRGGGHGPGGGWEEEEGGAKRTKGFKMQRAS